MRCDKRVDLVSCRVKYELKEQEKYIVGGR